MSAPFRVVIPPDELDKLRRWADWTELWNRRDHYLRALKTLNYRLTHEPRDDWSEPFRDLLGLKLQLRFGAVDMLGANYGVHADEAIVFVKQFLWLGDHRPLE